MIASGPDMTLALPQADENAFDIPLWPFVLGTASLVLLFTAGVLWLNRPDVAGPERRRRYRVIVVLLVLALVVLPLILVCFARRW